jgi:hypothetical protein
VATSFKPAGLFRIGATRGRLGHAAIQVALWVAVSAILLFLLGPSDGLIATLFRRQDLPVLQLGAVLLMALAVNPREGPAWALPASAWPVAALALAVVAFSAAGTWLVFADFPLTRDEILADFDGGILAMGRLAEPISGEWRPYAQALLPQVPLPAPLGATWHSDYLPGNAALRAIAERAIGMEWTNPLLAALSVVAVYGIGRRLWPHSAGAAIVAALLTATSAQVLTMAMTPFAMTAHLALNLIWLWCFLRGDWKGDAGALVAGFVATGLHQLIFHPLFVAPFVVQLVMQRHAGRALPYVLGYAAIGLFWASWWQILAAASGDAAPASASGVSSLAALAVDLLGRTAPSAGVTMAFNLARFIAWQNLLLLPLALLAWPALRDGEGIARPLAAGILLTLLAMLVLLPSQGFGWGYRYLHGLIGSFCLLAGYGWNSSHGERRRGFMLAAASVATMLILLPVQLKGAHDYTAPRARAYALVAQAPADIVIIVPFEDMYDGLVRNRPDLANRPKVMDLRALDAAQLAGLCRRYRVALFDITTGVRLGLPTTAPPDWISRFSAASSRLPCGTLLR